MLWGLFWEALEEMFTLINEMETTIKINTSIIFGNGSRLTGAKFNCLSEGPIPSWVEGSGGGAPHTWKGVKSNAFCGAGCVKRVSPRLL